ncbi:MAG: type II toxin-antitoxin system VapC family toxin [Holophagaceae bacterium]
MQEPGAEKIAAELAVGDPMICATNWAEVATRMIRGGIGEKQVRAALRALDLEVVPLDEDLALEAGLMEPETRALGLSLGDRSCLALALREGATVLTTDRAWLKWKGKAKVVCIR